MPIFLDPLGQIWNQIRSFVQRIMQLLIVHFVNAFLNISFFIVRVNASK